jgi:hypothetical protein
MSYLAKLVIWAVLICFALAGVRVQTSNQAHTQRTSIGVDTP